MIACSVCHKPIESAVDDVGLTIESSRSFGSGVHLNVHDYPACIRGGVLLLRKAIRDPDLPEEGRG